MLKGGGHGSFVYGFHKHVGILLLVGGGGYPSCSFHLNPSLRKREDSDPSGSVGTISCWVGNIVWCQYRAGRLNESFRRLETKTSFSTHWTHPTPAHAPGLPQPIPTQHVHILPKNLSTRPYTHFPMEMLRRVCTHIQSIVPDSKISTHPHSIYTIHMCTLVPVHRIPEFTYP